MEEYIIAEDIAMAFRPIVLTEKSEVRSQKPEEVKNKRMEEYLIAEGIAMAFRPWKQS